MSATVQPQARTEAFAPVNGTRLHYVEWRGIGAPLILVHGLGDNPFIFDDLAPAFTDRFRVVAYARRGHGQSEAKPPYDTGTLTDDLEGLLDYLRIESADLVGLSMGGNEITALAGRDPNRVGHLVYLDGGYDWADPAFKCALEAIPQQLSVVPPHALASLDAYRELLKETAFAGLADFQRVEPFIRDSVLIADNGSLQRRMTGDTESEIYRALFSDSPRRYEEIRCPVLAIYSSSLLNTHVADPTLRVQLQKYEDEYMAPFRQRSIERIKQEIHQVRILQVAGSHGNFIFESRDQVVHDIRSFLHSGMAH